MNTLYIIKVYPWSEEIVENIGKTNACQNIELALGCPYLIWPPHKRERQNRGGCRGQQVPNCQKEIENGITGNTWAK